jgi:hypothetical protein
LSHDRSSNRLHHHTAVRFGFASAQVDGGPNREIYSATDTVMGVSDRKAGRSCAQESSSGAA